jgi:cobalt-zinc-cadmium efflux system membrane fusion protein
MRTAGTLFRADGSRKSIGPTCVGNCTKPTKRHWPGGEEVKAKTLVLILIAALALAGLTHALTHRTAAGQATVAKHSDSEPGGVNVPGLQTAVAVAGEGWDSVVATGKVSVPQDRLVKISPRIAGKVVAAFGTAGDDVRRGQVLAVISSVELAQARAQYRKALASLSAAQKNLGRELQIAKLSAASARPLEQAQGESLSAQGELADAKSELAEAKSGLAKEESELDQCKTRLQRNRELYADQIVSKQDLETSEAECKRDSANVDMAKTRVSRAEARITTSAAKSDITKQYLSREEKVYKGRVLDMRSVQSARSEVAGAQVELQAAADAIRVLGANPSSSGDTIAVTSPISGRIISRNTNIGEMATASDALFAVANQAQVWIEADVYEKDLARVHKGQPAEIRVDAYPGGVFAGRVDSISDILSPESRTAKVRCVVANPESLLKGEMFAKVSLVVGRRGRTTLVPKVAVLDDAGKKIIFTACMDCPEDKQAGKSVCGNFDKAEVTTGSAHGDRVEILSGVEPGAEVVTVGAYQLKTALGSGKLKAGCCPDK